MPHGLDEFLSIVILGPLPELDLVLLHLLFDRADSRKFSLEIKDFLVLSRL